MRGRPERRRLTTGTRVSTSVLRGGLARRSSVVLAAGLTVGLLGAVAPAPVTVPANAETATTTSSAAGAGAGAVTADSAATVDDLSPVVASSVSTSATSRLMARMEASGHLRRYVCETDKRGTYTELTERGREAMAEAEISYRAAVEEMMASDSAQSLLRTLDLKD